MLYTLSYFFAAALLLGANQARAEHSFGMTLGAGYEFGRLGNGNLNLRDRTMGTASLDLLPGYQAQGLLVGPELSLRLHNQVTKLDEAGGTNLSGKSWTLGIGAKFDVNPKWSLQAVLRLFGKHQFDKQTASNEDDYMSSPLGAQIKAQYHVAPENPITLDLMAGYAQWRRFHISSGEQNSTTNQSTFGIGLTYHFAGMGPGQSPHQSD